MFVSSVKLPTLQFSRGYALKSKYVAQVLLNLVVSCVDRVESVKAIPGFVTGYRKPEGVLKQASISYD